MERLVNLLAPRSKLDVVVRSILLTLLLGFANWLRDMISHPLTHEGYLNNLWEAAVIGAPFTFLAFLMIGHLKNLQVRLYIVAHTDGLTGLPNRRAFVEQLELSLARRKGWLMMLDADHFKHVNDRYGHGAGDACLRAIADLMRQTAGSDDHLARLGGEEFAVLLPSLPIAGAVGRAERLSRGVIFTADDAERVPVTLSVGLVNTGGEREATALLKKADRALYRAKSEGRARAVLFDPVEDAVQPVDNPVEIKVATP